MKIPSTCLLDTHKETHQLLRKIQVPLRHPRPFPCCLLRQKRWLGGPVLRILSAPFPYIPGPLGRERRYGNPSHAGALIVLLFPSPSTERKLRLREVTGSGGRPRIQGPCDSQTSALGSSRKRGLHPGLVLCRLGASGVISGPDSQQLPTIASAN